MNNTAFTDRNAAVSNFRSRYGNQYTNHFTSEPSTRPSYIPQTYAVGGQNVTVIYNRSYGGYGYYHPLTHAWMMYDMFADAVMMNHMMSMNGYYYGAPPVAYGGGPGYAPGYAPAYYNPFAWVWGVITFIFWALLAIFIFWLIYRWASRRGDREVYDDGDSVTIITSTPTAFTPPPTTYTPPPAPRQPASGSVRREMHVFDNEGATPAFWSGLTTGSVVILTDPQALADSAKEGRGAVGREYTVEEVRSIREQHGLATWQLFRLREIQQDLWLLAKIVDQFVDLRIYFQLPDEEFKPGNRKDMVDRGNLWLFQQPANPEHFAYSELEYTTEIQGPSEPGQPPVCYQMKDQGVMAGTMTTFSGNAPAGKMFTMLAEYQATGDCENPELLLLEMGGIDPNAPDNCDDLGGLIILLQGSPITENEIEVLQNQQK